jgi:hypothetical protein
MSPEKRQHRGAHPEDARLFTGEQIPRLREATSDLSWLLGRGYAIKAAVKIVGDRYALTERQRLAVSRAACSEERKHARSARCVAPDGLANRCVVIDGFNLIITMEAALGGGMLLHCQDGCIRDLSSVHGSYRAVEETERAIIIIGEALENLRAGSARWLLDKQVSNSGRLAALLRQIASEHAWAWEIEVVFNPDREMAASDLIITSDSTVLDAGVWWINFGAYLIANEFTGAWMVELQV